MKVQKTITVKRQELKVYKDEKGNPKELVMKTKVCAPGASDIQEVWEYDCDTSTWAREPYPYDCQSGLCGRLGLGNRDTVISAILDKLTEYYSIQVAYSVTVDITPNLD